MQTLMTLLHFSCFGSEHHHWFWPFPFFGFFIFILFIFLIFRRRGWRRDCYSWWGYGWDGCYSSRRHNAIDILDNRYAKGEISKEEYEKLKKDIL